MRAPLESFSGPCHAAVASWICASTAPVYEYTTVAVASTAMCSLSLAFIIRPYNTVICVWLRRPAFLHSTRIVSLVLCIIDCIILALAHCTDKAQRTSNHHILVASSEFGRAAIRVVVVASCRSICSGCVELGPLFAACSIMLLVK